MKTNTIRFSTWKQLHCGEYVVAGNVVLLPPKSSALDALRAWLLSKRLLHN